MKPITLLCILLLAACGSNREAEPQTLMRPDIADLGALRQERIVQAESALQNALKEGDPKGKAEAYGALAMHYHAYRAEEAAVFYYGKAMESQPEHFLWPYLQGKALKNLTRLDEGHRKIEEARQLNSEYPPILVELGEYHRKRNETPKARSYFEQALGIDPACVAAMVGLAQTALSADDHQQAWDLMEKALEIQPKAAMAHYAAAMAARGLGRLEDAETHLAKREDGLELHLKDPVMEQIRSLSSDGGANFKKGQEAMAQGHFEEARKWFEAAVASQPNIPEYWTKLGFANIKTGDLESALKAYQRVLQDRPAHPDIHYNIAGLLMEMERPRDAIPYFDKAFELDPENKRARLFAVDLHRTGGNFEKALAYYLAMAGEDATEMEGRLGRALMLIGLNRHGEARAFLEDDVKKYPGQPAFNQALARILAASPDPKVRDGAQAMALSEALLKQGADSALAETRAMALAETGQFTQAVQWQQKARELARSEGADPNSADLSEPLKQYQNGQALRKPWPDNAPIFFVPSYGRR